MLQSKQMKKRWGFRLIALGISAAVAIAIGEAMLWLIQPVPFREFTKWELDGRIGRRAKPHQVIYNSSGHGVRINQYGFRGPDWKAIPDKGTIRILAFGGSSTFNFDASDDQSTWPNRLAHHIEKRVGLPVEVLNLGIPAADMTHSKVNYLFLGRHLKPHVVLFYHTWNDMYRFRRLEDGAPYVFLTAKLRKPWWENIGRKTQIGRRTHSLLRHQRRQRVEREYRALEKDGQREHEPAKEVAWQWFEQNYRDATRFANSDGVLPVLISQATIVQPANLKKLEYRLLFKSETRQMTAPVIVDTYKTANSLIERVAKEESAVFVAGYDAVPPDFEHLLDFVHLTDKGMDTLAKEIATTLIGDDRFQEIVTDVQHDTSHLSAK